MSKEKEQCNFVMDYVEKRWLEQGADMQGISVSRALRAAIPTRSECEVWRELTQGGLKKPFIGFDVSELKAHALAQLIKSELLAMRYPPLAFTANTSAEFIFNAYIDMKKALRREKGYSLDVVNLNGEEFYIPHVDAV